MLIHVKAAGVGVWDPFEREGGFAKEFNIKPVFPLVLGSDGAGTVKCVGPQVKRFKIGDPRLRNFLPESEGRIFMRSMLL